MKGQIGDCHDVSKLSRYHGEDLLEQFDYALGLIEPHKIIWETSTYARRRLGLCKPLDDGYCSVRISKFALERGGVEGFRQIILHELIHVWQVQNPALVEFEHHGPSFTQKSKEVGLSGKHYEDIIDYQKQDYRYIMECPECNSWWGRQYISKYIRQTARGKRYCDNCGVNILLQNDNYYLTPDENTQKSTIKDFYNSPSLVPRAEDITTLKG